MTIPSSETTTTNTRLQVIFTDVLQSLLDIIRKHQVTWDEYRAATAWLTEAGAQGYEIPLMMDVFLSQTVDDVNFGAQGGTESNVEGPFYVADAQLLERPYVLPQREGEAGERLMFSGTVSSTDGSPLAGAVVDVWQASAAGECSNFHPTCPEGNLRGRFTTDHLGRFELEVYGVGPIVAAHLIGYTGDVSRFPSAGHYARYNGTAPIEASSGPKKRHRLNPRGNRQLNHAIT